MESMEDSQSEPRLSRPAFSEKSMRRSGDASRNNMMTMTPSPQKWAGEANTVDEVVQMWGSHSVVISSPQLLRPATLSTERQSRSPFRTRACQRSQSMHRCLPEERILPSAKLQLNPGWVIRLSPRKSEERVEMSSCRPQRHSSHLLLQPSVSPGKHHNHSHTYNVSSPSDVYLNDEFRQLLKTPPPPPTSHFHPHNVTVNNCPRSMYLNDEFRHQLTTPPPPPISHPHVQQQTSNDIKGGCPIAVHLDDVFRLHLTSPPPPPPPPQSSHHSHSNTKRSHKTHSSESFSALNGAKKMYNTEEMEVEEMGRHASESLNEQIRGVASMNVGSYNVAGGDCSHSVPPAYRDHVEIRDTHLIHQPLVNYRLSQSIDVDDDMARKEAKPASGPYLPPPLRGTGQGALSKSARRGEKTAANVTNTSKDDLVTMAVSPRVGQNTKQEASPRVDGKKENGTRASPALDRRSNTRHSKGGHKGKPGNESHAPADVADIPTPPVKQECVDGPPPPPPPTQFQPRAVARKEQRHGGRLDPRRAADVSRLKQEPVICRPQQQNGEGGSQWERGAVPARRLEQQPPPPCCDESNDGWQHLEEERRLEQEQKLLEEQMGITSFGGKDKTRRSVREDASASPAMPAARSNARRSGAGPRPPTWSEVREILSQFSGCYIDSHCHLDFIFNSLSVKDKFTSVAELRAKFPAAFPDAFAGCITNFIDPRLFVKEVGGSSCDINWIQTILKSPEVAGATFGVHPHHSGSWSDKCEQFIQHMCGQDRRESKIVAIGECGVDLSGKNKVPLEKQLYVLEEQMKIAMSAQLPIVIHCRSSSGGTEAEEPVLGVLTRMNKWHSVHRHCFCENEAVARRWITSLPNCVFGFTPGVWQFREEQIRAVEMIPLDRIILETDAPYFTPAAMRDISDRLGKCNLPPMAVVTAIKIAHIKGVSVNEVLYHSYLNTCRIYQLEMGEDGQWIRNN